MRNDQVVAKMIGIIEKLQSYVQGWGKRKAPILQRAKMTLNLLAR